MLNIDRSMIVTFRSCARRVFCGNQNVFLPMREAAMYSTCLSAMKAVPFLIGCIVISNHDVICRGEVAMRTQSFDHDPGWEGINNRSAREREPIIVRQDFSFSPGTSHTGGKAAGEMGGFISPAGEAAFYGKAIEPASLDKPLAASGTMMIGKGGTHLLLGFFNHRTLNEWRTPNTVAIRINSRGEIFFAYIEYCTAKWRAGGDTTPFPHTTGPQTGRWNLLGFPCEKPLPWSLKYDPAGNGGKGVITATIGSAQAICNLDTAHKSDGAAFDRFGIVNIIKSVDSGSEVWFDDIQINGTAAEAFDRDPHWDGRNNRRTATTRMVRPWFDFGYSDTHFAGGKAQGELGGQMFRGDCREVPRMACYGDRVGPLALDKPLRAAGKVVLTRGVSDSTTLFGFYNSHDSMRRNDAQDDRVPESVLGVHIEGPSSDGFRFYPVFRAKGEHSSVPNVREFPPILPDGKCHDWTLDYVPGESHDDGRITVTLDGKAGTLDVTADAKQRGTTFDRFGIVTSWIDGNSQQVYWDDIQYTAAQD